MTTTTATIAQAVAAHLDGCSEEEYEAFASEFEAQAGRRLIEAAAMTGAAQMRDSEGCQHRGNTMVFNHESDPDDEMSQQRAAFVAAVQRHHRLMSEQPAGDDPVASSHCEDCASEGADMLSRRADSAAWRGCSTALVLVPLLAALLPLAMAICWAIFGSVQP